MKKITSGFEKVVIITLIFLMGLVVIASTVELAYDIISVFFKPGDKVLLVDLNKLYDIFSLFFYVLIGFELYETLKFYLKDNVFHAELILLVGLVAVSRKVILIDYKTMDPLAIMAMALLIGTLTGGYYLIKKSNKNK